MTETPALTLHDLHHHYGNVPILQAVSLSVPEGQTLALLGASGCGKTTLLRCIAGFETITQGNIYLKGREVSSPQKLLPPEKRGVGVVFQDYALFPHLTVEQNIGFGIRQRPAAARRSKVQELLASVGLHEHAGKFPRQLSGGQQQRVALARALAPEPGLLLLDEPFSHLDPALRERMKGELKKLLKSFGVTAILVTHDHEEAFDIADQIALMIQGRIAQMGTPHELYFQPDSQPVADFLGRGFFIPILERTESSVLTELGALEAPSQETHTKVFLRPDNIQIEDTAPCKVRVHQVQFRGTHQIIWARTAKGCEIRFLHAGSAQRVTEGETLGVCLSPRQASWILF